MLLWGVIPPKSPRSHGLVLVLAISCHATLHKYCLLLLNHGRGIEATKNLPFI